MGFFKKKKESEAVPKLTKQQEEEYNATKNALSEYAKGSVAVFKNAPFYEQLEDQFAKMYSDSYISHVLYTLYTCIADPKMSGGSRQIDNTIINVWILPSQDEAAKQNRFKKGYMTHIHEMIELNQWNTRQVNIMDWVLCLGDGRMDYSLTIIPSKLEGFSKPNILWAPSMLTEEENKQLGLS